MEEKYKLIKDLTQEDTWKFDKGNDILKAGIFCTVEDWNRCLTIMYHGKAICDVDSRMERECFVKS